MNKPNVKETVTFVITDRVQMSTQVSGVTSVDDVAVAYTESPRDGRAAHASLDPNGINHGFSGSPPTNETGTLQTCTYLIAAMNKAGATWGPPASGGDHDDVDAVCNRLDGGPEVLSIQVVRAQSRAAFWKEAYTNKGIAVNGAPSELADELRASISHKAKLPAAQRSQLVLALSALHTPGYALGDVANRFQEVHGAWAKEIGFREIWLVGPGVDLTYRLA